MDSHSQKKWSDPSILRALPNPATKGGYEIRIENPELTFLGVKGQPDFGIMRITFHPRDTIIELKSLKLYICAFRQTIISYERLLDVLYDDLMSVYNPNRLRITLKLNPRGGMPEFLQKDSDWKINGGKEEFKNWTPEPGW